MALVLPLYISYLTPDYKSSIRFKSSTERHNFFAFFPNYSSSGSGSQYTSINFEFNNVLQTKTHVPMKDSLTQTAAQRVHFYLSCNYLHVVDDIVPSALKHFYYFITNAKMVSAEVVEYTLELDVFSTYIDQMSITEPLLTERKHCNRFKSYTLEGATRYIFRPDDVVLGDEMDGQFNARIFDYETYKNIEYFDANSTITDSTLRNNINNALSTTLWLYVFVQVPEEDPIGNGTLLQNLGGIAQASMDTGVKMLFAPFRPMILRNMKLTTPEDKVWSARKLYKMANGESKINPRVVSIRVSPIAPFNNRMRFNDDPDDAYFDFVSGGTYDGALRINYFGLSSANQHDDIYFPYKGTTDTNWFVATGYGSNASTWGDDVEPTVGIYVLSSVQKDSTGAPSRLITTYDFDTEMPDIPSTALSNANDKNKGYEPKLFSLPYKRYELMTQYSMPKEINEIYLGQKVKFECSDIPSATDQKYTYAVSRDSNNYYYKKQILTNNALTGNNAYELPILTDQFASYVANHSNYLLTGLAIPVMQGAVQMGIQASTLDVRGALTTGLNTAVEVAQFGLKMDDLRRAPDTLKATGNNLFHDVANFTDLKLRLLKYTLTPEQQESVFDYFYNYGYRVNRECYWADFSSKQHDALFNRTRFNYVKLMDDEIVRKLIFSSTQVPIIIKQKIAEILNRGIKFIESTPTNTAINVIANFGEIKENVEQSIIST
jgi:hypothetical protein